MWLPVGIAALIVIIAVLGTKSSRKRKFQQAQEQEAERLAAGIRPLRVMRVPTAPTWDPARVRAAIGRHTSEEVAVRTPNYMPAHAAPVALDLETFQTQEARRRALFMRTAVWKTVPVPVKVPVN